MLKLVASSFCSNTVKVLLLLPLWLSFITDWSGIHSQGPPSLQTALVMDFAVDHHLVSPICFFKLQYLLLWTEYTKIARTSGLETVTNFNCGWILKEHILEGFVFHFTAWRYPTSLIKLHEENQNPKSWEDYSVWYGKIKSPNTTSSGYALE